MKMKAMIAVVVVVEQELRRPLLLPSLTIAGPDDDADGDAVMAFDCA